MTFPAITSFWAAILAIVFVLLSGWVVGGRLQTNVLFGNGEDDNLTRRVRSQANFAEYVPFALLLIALLEARGANHVLIHILCIVLLVARLAHPIGMLAGPNTPQQYACRGGGILSTFGVILVTAILLIVHVA